MPDATRLTTFYDPLSYAAYDHPYEIYRELRAHAPVYYNERRDLWVVSRYEDVKACLRDHQRMVNALGNDMDGTHASYGAGNLIAQDQPVHTVLRNVVRPSFAAREILAMETYLRGLARDLLTALKDRGSGDFAMDVALPLVFGASMRLMGIPASDSRFWQEHLLRSMARTVGRFGVPEDASNSNREAEEHLAEIMRQRQADIDAGATANSADVITQILSEVAKGTLDEQEQIGLAHLVLSASTDAPAALLTNCVAILDKFPAIQSYLRQHPGLAADFVEETLRYEGPAKNLCRQTTAEVTIAGVRIPADSRVMVLMGSANRDERVYSDPDSFDLFRVFGPDTKILTFGEGIHSCMGAPIARMVARIAVAELTAVLDGLELRIVGIPQRWTKQMVRGFSSLPVQLVGKHEESAARQELVPKVHVERVRQRTTELTLATRELETEVLVSAKREVAEGVVALTLKAADGRQLPQWEPGAHVDLILDNAATRQYSLCGDPADRQHLRLGILRDPNGSGGSRYVHDQLRAGDKVRIRGPRNNFSLVGSGRYIFIAGGIGITPILAMIRAADQAGADWQLIYGGRRRSSMAFLDELAAYGDRVTIWPQDEHGLIDLKGLLGLPRPDSLVYCCGPEPLLTAVEQNCIDWPADALHVERFVAKPLTEPVRQEAFEVQLAKSGLIVTVPPEKSILGVVREAGVGVLSSCEEGTCGTCETPVLAGLPDHRDSVLDPAARQRGDCMMICVSRSCTERLVLEL